MTVGSFIRGAFTLAALLATLTQIFIDPSLDNVVSSCIVLTSSLAILLYMHWSDTLRTHPLSVFVIFGFCLTTQLGALLVQTAYWTPLRSSLYDSVYTFGTLAFYQATALGVHAIYCYFSAPPGSTESWARAIFRKAGLYIQPSVANSWILGGIGVLGILVSSRAGMISKFAHGVDFLTWAPFLIPLYRRGNDQTSGMSRQLWTGVIFYTALIALIGVAFNGRAAIFKGALTLVLLYLLHGLRSGKKMQTFVNGPTLVRFGTAALIAAMAISPLSRLVDAMAAARASRGKIPPSEMVVKTYDFLLHPELIRDSDIAAPNAPLYLTAYDEVYFSRPLFGRLIETKFHDNALHFGQSILSDDSWQRLKSVTVDSWLAELPTPLLRALEITVNKNTMQFSMGDLLFYLARGGGLGGFKTGSIFGQGVALMGPLFPLFYAVICLCIFHWLRLLTYFSGPGQMAIASVAMMNIWPLVQYGIAGDSLANFSGSIVRGFPQWILMYLIALAIARCLLKGVRFSQAGPDQVKC